MGLDMYLTESIYVSEYTNTELYEKLSGIVGKDVCSVSIERAYWRKANHIHKWFVDNVQDGDDNCQEYYVSKEKLQELIDVCKKALDVANIRIDDDGERYISNHVAVSRVLPAERGFFFGSQEYDEYYIYKTEYTIEKIEGILSKDIVGSLCYRSSW